MLVVVFYLTMRLSAEFIQRVNRHVYEQSTSIGQKQGKDEEGVEGWTGKIFQGTNEQVVKLTSGWERE